MKENLIATEPGALRMHWADQFMRESERGVLTEEAGQAAQTVLFYTGLLLESKSGSNSGEAVNPSLAACRARAEWMLASEEEWVREAYTRVPAVFHPLLKQCLGAVKSRGNEGLTHQERAEIQIMASAYIHWIRIQFNHLAGSWFH